MLVLYTATAGIIASAKVPYGTPGIINIPQARGQDKTMTQGKEDKSRP